MPIVGIVGDGQLARMMVSAAIELGIEPRVLGTAPDGPAGIATTAIGRPDDEAAVVSFGEGVDVVTFDHEHVPQSVLAALLDAGVDVQPPPHALRFAQDKLAMRRRLTELGVPVPAWAEAATREDVAAFLADNGGAAVAKTPTGGYDGKGVRVIRSADGADDWLAAGPVLLEELVEFRRELAQLIARRPSGGTAVWPVVQTEQRDGVCAEVIAPAPDAEGRVAEAARHIAEAIAEGLGVTGVLAVELFETSGGELLVNELAMRPHNSGHWSMDGAVTGQFEQHLRAVLDLPLGDPSPRQEWAVMVNILGGPAGETMPDRYPAVLADEPGVKVHTYGKSSRPGRKVGHVNAFGDALEDVVVAARAAAAGFDA